MKKLVICLSMAAVLLTGTASAMGPNGNATKQQRVSLTPDERGDLAYTIVAKWSPEAWARYKITPAKWAERMLTTFVNADAATLRNAAKMPTFDGMMATLIGQPISSPSMQALMAAGPQDAKIGNVPTKAAPSALADLVYTPLPSGRCRVADSRNITALPAVSTRSLVVWGTSSYAAQGGTGSSAGQGSTNCGIPANPVALAVSVTVIPVDPNGFFKIFEQGKAFSEGNTVLYANGQSNANDVIVRSCVGCGTELSVYSNASTNYVVDVVGYYMPPVAQALECQTIPASDTAAGNATSYVSYPAAPVGFTKVGGFCSGAFGSSAGYLLETGPTSCTFRNLSASTFTMYAYGSYCRAPGR